jgi:hypothetical protein
MVRRPQISDDFNGDGTSDLLWHNEDGRTEAWLGTTAGGFVTAGPIFGGGPNFVTGDFNGDGKTDVLQFGSTVFGVNESAADGTFYFNYESADGFTPNWTIAGAGDFNGDGYSDILWRAANGAISDWLGYTRPDDLNFLGDPIGLFKDNVANAGSSVSTDWQIAGIADFNGDGRDDILWRNTDGRMTDWLGAASGALQPNSANLLETVSTDWKAAGVGDFNGDGKADILWRNDDGRITDWLGTGSGAFTDNVANAYNSVSLDWHVADVGDYNGDGRADIAWRNDDGRMTDWLGTANGGFQPNSANALYGPSVDWHIVPHDVFVQF